jgi:phosphotransferase system HPr-like phosphotransfer protein
MYDKAIVEAIKKSKPVKVKDREDIDLWMVDLTENHNLTLEVEAKSADEAIEKLVESQESLKPSEG